MPVVVFLCGFGLMLYAVDGNVIVSTVIGCILMMTGIAMWHSERE